MVLLGGAGPDYMGLPFTHVCSQLGVAMGGPGALGFPLHGLCHPLVGSPTPVPMGVAKSQDKHGMRS